MRKLIENDLRIAAMGSRARGQMSVSIPVDTADRIADVIGAAREVMGELSGNSDYVEKQLLEHAFVNLDGPHAAGARRIPADV